MTFNFDELECPACRGNLRRFDIEFVCLDCARAYPVSENNVPMFITPNAVEAIKPGRAATRDVVPMSRLRRLFTPPLSNYAASTRATLPELKGQKVLNIGSADAEHLEASPADAPDDYGNIVNVDIAPFANVDIVADGKNLPFKDNSFDIVICESVLEHVDEPCRIIDEAARVLRSGGEAYFSMPFVFIFHDSPNDFNRMTLPGLSKHMEEAGLKISRSGVIAGPGSTFSMSARYFLASLFSFNNKFLFSLGLNVFGWLTFPFKYFDALLNKYDNAHIAGNVIYAVGVKE